MLRPAGAWRLGGALWLGMPGVVAVVWTLLPTLKANAAPAAAAARGCAVAQRVADGGAPGAGRGAGVWLAPAWVCRRLQCLPGWAGHLQGLG